jgi:hypothetical protein
VINSRVGTDYISDGVPMDIGQAELTKTGLEIVAPLLLEEWWSRNFADSDMLCGEPGGTLSDELKGVADAGGIDQVGNVDSVGLMPGHTFW